MQVSLLSKLRKIVIFTINYDIGNHLQKLDTLRPYLVCLANFLLELFALAEAQVF